MDDKAIYYTSKRGSKVVDITDAAFLDGLMNGWSVWKAVPETSVREELRYVKKLRGFVTVQEFYEYRSTHPLVVSTRRRALWSQEPDAPVGLTPYHGN